MGYVADVFDEQRLSRLPPDGRSATSDSTAAPPSAAETRSRSSSRRAGPLALAPHGNLVNAREILAAWRHPAMSPRLRTPRSCCISSPVRALRDSPGPSRRPSERSAGPTRISCSAGRGSSRQRDPTGSAPLSLGILEGRARRRLGRPAPRPDRRAVRARRWSRAEIAHLAAGAPGIASQPLRVPPVDALLSRRLLRAPRPPCSAERRRDAGGFGAASHREQPAAADVVVPVPDSGMYAAAGLRAASRGSRSRSGSSRNHYVGRTSSSRSSRSDTSA